MFGSRLAVGEWAALCLPRVLLTLKTSADGTHLLFSRFDSWTISGDDDLLVYGLSRRGGRKDRRGGGTGGQAAVQGKPGYNGVQAEARLSSLRQPRHGGKLSSAKPCLCPCPGGNCCLSPVFCLGLRIWWWGALGAAAPTNRVTPFGSGLNANPPVEAADESWFSISLKRCAMHALVSAPLLLVLRAEYL